MKKNTFKYYKEENGAFKTEMTQDAARDVANSKAGFEACARIAIYDKPIRKLRVADYIANTFLEDRTCYEAMKLQEYVSDDGKISGYDMFLNAVEAKISELLG